VNIPIANENYGFFSDAGKVSNFDRMWKRPSRPHIICDGYMLLLARPSGLAIYCSLEMHIFLKFELRWVYILTRHESNLV